MFFSSPTPLTRETTKLMISDFHLLFMGLLQLKCCGGVPTLYKNLARDVNSRAIFPKIAQRVTTKPLGIPEIPGRRSMNQHRYDR